MTKVKNDAQNIDRSRKKAEENKQKVASSRSRKHKQLNEEARNEAMRSIGHEMTNYDEQDLCEL